MMQKPADLLLSVLSFFGVLIPGAIFVFLHGDTLLRLFGLPMLNLQEPQNWVPAFFVSLLLGHFLQSMSSSLDKPAAGRLSKRTMAYQQEAVIHGLSLPADVARTPPNWFHAAFSFVRVNNAAAVTELEQSTANYKLFRSLALLFALDFLLVLFFGTWTPARLIASPLIGIFAAFRFKQLFDWTYALAFDFYVHVKVSLRRKQ